jgi:hypothetical protein
MSTSSSQRELARLAAVSDGIGFSPISPAPRKRTAVFCGDRRGHTELDLRSKANVKNHGRENARRIRGLVKAGFLDTFREFSGGHLFVVEPMASAGPGTSADGSTISSSDRFDRD